jgi:hypothetical protein
VDSSRPLHNGSGIRVRGPLLHALAALAFASAVAAPLHAAEPPPKAAPSGADDDEEEGPEAGKRRAAAPDTRFGHLLIDPRTSVTIPVGRLTSLASAGSVTGTGVSFGGVVGFGISRYVAVEASGGYSLFSGPSDCSGCRGRGFDLGLGFSYHLAQGVAIDPWASFGVGFRSATFRADIDARGKKLDKPSDQSYRGLDFARIALGADFYPLPALGLGPYVEADVGTNVSRPGASGLATYAFIHVGVRIALDPFRSGSPRPRTTVGRR